MSTSRFHLSGQGSGHGRVLLWEYLGHLQQVLYLGLFLIAGALLVRVFLNALLWA